ncbi:MAG: T9SS type A sorting domain-containing protein [Bacteroidales bacterium]|nr:T9SS type A sorting domain-containing protein [Bacteroidales bacterium]
MKSIFSLSILLIINILSYSQTTFFKYFPSQYSESISELIQTNNQEFILVGAKGPNDVESRGYCVKVNNIGNIIQTLDINSDNKISRLGTINPFPGSQNRFVVSGDQELDNSNPVQSMLTFTVINDSLQVIQTKEIIMESGRRVNVWKATIVDDSILYLLARYDSVSANQVDFIVLKLNLQFDIIGRYHHPSTYPMNVPQDIFFVKSNETIYVYYFGPIINDITSTNNVLCLDRDLNYRYGAPAERMITVNISASPLNDSIFFVTGSAFSNHTADNRDIGLFLVNDSNKTIKVSEFWESYDTLVYPSRGGGMVSVDKKNSVIYLAGIFNMNFDNYPYLTKPTWVQFLKTDFDLNIKGHTLFGGDAVYFPSDIIDVKESGALIVGTRFNHLTPDNKHVNIFILKTDTAGRVLSLPENQKYLMSEAILAPNPGSEYCIALLGPQYKSATLRMYDMNGGTVLFTEIKQQKTKIDLPGLAKGMYLYTFEHDGRIIGRGKWIRE